MWCSRLGRSPLSVAVSTSRSFHFATTHVGSLPRPQALIDHYLLRPEEPPDTEVLMKAVKDVVKRQVELGITVVGDGEMSKPSYVSYVKHRLEGFGGKTLGPSAADLQDFPDFAKQQVEIGAVIPRGSSFVSCCLGPVQYKDLSAVRLDVSLLDEAVKQNQPKDGAFLTAASPGVVALFNSNKFYKNHEEYVEALVPQMAKEYEEIVKHGFKLQLDCPDLAMGRHHAYSKLSEEEFLKIASINVAAMNAATANIPPDMLRMHLCWGNWHGPHHKDIDIRKIFKIVMSARPTTLLLESANPRHNYEVDTFLEMKDDIPEEKILVPGVIDSTSNFIEHPQLVAKRLLAFANIVRRDRVMAGSDCGFATFGQYPTVHPDIAWAKLAAMVEGANIAANKC